MVNASDTGRIKRYVIEAPAIKSRVAATHPGKKTRFSFGVKPGTTNPPIKYNMAGSDTPRPPRKQIFMAIKMGE